MIARAICLASDVNTQHLRSQLDQLHSEADTTRRKANNARFRLLRLSEAAENLCRQAAVSVQVGKENDARELLLQKKKVMLALEKSKGRVELLDELAAKLNEAVSIKEAQLVRNVASDLEFGGDDSGSPVRIVSPTQDTLECLDDDNNVILKNTHVSKDQDLMSDIKEESINSGNKASILSSFRGISSYTDFLDHLDQQISKIEEELVTFLELSTLGLENGEKPNSSRVQQILEILENIRGTRMRILNLVQKNEDCED